MTDGSKARGRRDVGHAKASDDAEDTHGSSCVNASSEWGARLYGARHVEKRIRGCGAYRGQPDVDRSKAAAVAESCVVINGVRH